MKRYHQQQSARTLVQSVRSAKQLARADAKFFKAALAAAEARIDTLEAELQFVSRQILAHTRD